MGTIFFIRSMAARLASNAGPRRGEATTIATLASPGSTRPMRWTMETSRTSQRSLISAPISSSFLSAIGRYASYSRYSTDSPPNSSILVVPTKVEIAPQSGLWAADMSVATSIGPSTTANTYLAPGDRRQNGDLVARGNAGFPARELAVDGEGQSIAHGGEPRVPLRQQRPQLVERDLPCGEDRLAGARAVCGRPEEQYLYAVHLYS